MRCDFRKTALIIVLMMFTFCKYSFSQTLNAGLSVLEENLRRAQLLGDFSPLYSFQNRPIQIFADDSSRVRKELLQYFYGTNRSIDEKVRFTFLPLVSNNTVNTKRPYGWGNRGMIPNVGFQTYLSTGFFAKYHFIELQLQPEFIFAQNKPFEGFSDKFSTPVTQARFFYWNNGDNPERFGNDYFSRLWWGQSSINIIAGPISLGLSTQNIWWGPGQFNALIFSNNAEGFPHLSLNTRRPLKTFLGDIEAQLIVGRLENSGISPTQSNALNQKYFEDFTGDWRYLNAISINYNPVFLPKLFLGFNRTFQQYNKLKGNGFSDWFPVFEIFQKERFFDDGNTIVYDSKGQDQQVSVSFRYLVPSAKFEIYAELGRRDHSFNWREFMLNPEHARAYLAGFQKLFALSKPNTFIQIRGEMTHQQESVNRYIRYPGLIGNQTWHTHGLARGFVNYGQSLGVGSGVGVNVQTFEISQIEGLNKIGVRLERLENHQDFFYRAFGQSPNKKPWVDFSLGVLVDHQWGNLILSSKTQFVSAYNYQWLSEGNSTVDFPSGVKKLSFSGELNLIYLFQNN
jgi:hypothetical protein